MDRLERALLERVPTHDEREDKAGRAHTIDLFVDAGTALRPVRQVDYAYRLGAVHQVKANEASPREASVTR
jgi:hypothetical protein